MHGSPPDVPGDVGHARHPRLREIMSWSLDTVTRGTPCGVARQLAVMKAIHQLLVLDHGMLDGIICECALADAPDAAPVGRYCRTPVVTVSDHASCEEAVTVMRSFDVCALPVLHRGFLIGIVTAGDLVRAGVLADGTTLGCRSSGPWRWSGGAPRTH